MLMLALPAASQDFEVDGIYYNITEIVPYDIFCLALYRKR